MPPILWIHLHEMPEISNICDIFWVKTLHTNISSPPKKEPMRDQSKDHTNVQLNEPKFLLSLTGVWVRSHMEQG